MYYMVSEDASRSEAKKEFISETKSFMYYYR